MRLSFPRYYIFKHDLFLYLAVFTSLKQWAYSRNAMPIAEYELMRSIRFNKVSPRCDLRDFQNERLVYDTHNDRFPRFARTKGRNSASRPVEMIRARGNVFTGNQASYFITQPDRQ